MSKGAIVQAIAKAPQLKGRHADFMKKHLTIGISLSITMMVLVKFIVNEPRKKGYAEYYKSYDIEAEFNRIRNAGWFQSCGAD